MSIIQDKAAQLHNAGFDLGNPTTPELDAGFGGWMRDHEHGRLYWHPVMGQEAHEVHGGILGIYVANGAHGLHPVTGERRFGFPISDEEVSGDGRNAMSRFEFGTIFWREGAGPVYGSIHKRWKIDGGELGYLGYPVSPRFETGAGEVQVFERGLCGEASDVNSVAAFSWIGPQLGSPLIHRLDDLPLELRMFQVASPSAPGSAGAFVQALERQFLLRPTTANGSSSGDVRLRLRVGESETLIAVALSPLANRTLYDICVEHQTGGVGTVASHVVYAKQHWHSFGFVHVTDAHVARRNDELPSRLRNAGRDSSRFNNFNDNFRDFIRFANRAYAKGRLDLLLFTGDLVDYIYESNDRNPSRGNFGLFEDLLLGRSPYPERNEPVEELRVPIVTVLGNHDYRTTEYPLAFDLTAGEIEVHTLDSTSAFNLQKADALAIDGHDVTHGEPWALRTVRVLPGLDSTAAARIVAIDDAMAHGEGYYFRKFNRSRHTLLRLGIHRIVLVDTRWDDGIVSDLSTGLWAEVFGVGSAAQHAFLGGSPSSIGVDQDGVRLVERAIREANALSIVIVGLHAPLFDIRDFRYFHYLRETEHAKTSRQTIAAFAGLMYSTQGTNYVVPGAWDHTGTPYFASEKRGRSVEFLDQNISELGSQEIIDCILGLGSSRKADLVLFGHGHHRVEFGLGYDPDKAHRLYFMDHYLGNPTIYYRSRAASTAYDVRIGLQGTPLPVAPSHGSALVPAYAEPLNTATDHWDWWNDHRPVLCETAGIGPLESGQTGPSPAPTFLGVRLFEVRDDLIKQATYIGRSQLLDPTVV